MAIVEVLTIELGGAIAKAILKFWLKDHSIAADITSDLIGLIKGKTKDVLAQNRAKRQLEAIGEKVAETLLPIFEAERILLDESSQIAIVVKISEILNNSKIDTRLLAENDLEPINLLKYLRELNPQRTKNFSQDETVFFERILSDVCQNIIDIASELPGFTEQTLAEVLKREGDLIQKADLILAEVKRIRKSSERNDATAQASTFEAEYRRTIVRKLDELELFGADVSRASKRHRLSVAYVTLSVEEPATHSNKNGQLDSEIDEQNDDSTRIMSVDEIILSNPRLFIKGDAGSGKTTLLQWIAVRSASSDFTGKLSVLNEYIPFFIRLRQCADRGLPAPQEFPELIVSTIADTMPKGWVHEKLMSGNAIVLVDGLDEVAQNNRNEVRDWIRELTISFPAARFILSSRPTATDVDWLKPEGFYESTLQSMTKQDIFAFIDHWHSAVADALQDEAERDELKPLAEKLKSVIESNRSIYNLATTPLLCAMISALHRERRSQLPRDRIELYEACTSMLLERREIERKIDYSDYPNLTYRQKRALLNYFAYWLIKNKLSLVEVERADLHFESRLKIVEGLAKTTGTDIRRLFLERSGLLREPIKGSLHFAHRTFQEFLAAQAAIDEDDIGVLVSNAHDDQWREVVILAAGLASQKKREALIAELINRGDNEQSSRHQLHLLSVACLETSVLLGPEIKQEIEKRLKQLKLPKNMTEAKQWASAGELSIPYLLKGNKENVTIASACVRALLLIGGEISLKSLESFAKDNRSTVMNELDRGVEYYDLSIYSKFIFSKNRGFASRFRQITSLTGIEYLDYLEKITICGDLNPEFRNHNKVINNLEVISNLKKLSYLKISGFSNNLSIKPLNKLTKLNFLVLDNLKMIESLDELSGVENIETLLISNCENLKNINAIRKFRNLRNLRIEKSNSISDLSFLSELPDLEALSMPEHNNVSNLDFLSNCKKIKYLGLPYCSSLDDVSKLSMLENLETVSFCGCNKISDISPLLNIKSLHTLDLAMCASIKDLQIIQNLKDLLFLSLMGAKVSDSQSLQLSLPNLRAVNLIGTEGISADVVKINTRQSSTIINYPQDIYLSLLREELDHVSRRRKFEVIRNEGSEQAVIQSRWEKMVRRIQDQIEQLEKNKSNFNSKEIRIEWNVDFFGFFSNLKRRPRFYAFRFDDNEEHIYDRSLRETRQKTLKDYINLLVNDLMVIDSKYSFNDYLRVI